jgi:peptide chain release factor 3
MQTISAPESFEDEVARRRTFAIISHPDAGKTTLTEKFLLYGGAVRLAGSVTARKQQRATTSDWLELERKRGISVSSTVLQFEYQGFRINLLDTPGHQDFSEDTYRVLTAVDAVIMVIDAGKGIESQTLKLFDVCRHRGVPIFTFMNKMDRPAREPLELLDELERVLGISAYPVNWPMGMGPDFRGVWDRRTKTAHLFERTAGGAYRAPVSTGGLDDPAIRQRLDDATFRQVSEEVEILEAAGTEYDPAGLAEGRVTPVYFGSAVNNFGIELLLDGFLEHAPPPAPRISKANAWVVPSHPFSGFVFKIQANMDPQHRDRVAFIRIVSGKFERDMSVTLARTGRKVRLSNASKIFGSERMTVDEAYPGDVVGIVGNGNFAIGDTLTEDPGVVFDEIPYFAPECFTYLEGVSTAEAKRFNTGLEQLLHEGVVQAYDVPGSVRRMRLLGAAGPLQFEVVQYRLESEYGAKSRMLPANWSQVRWLDPGETGDDLNIQSGVQLALDGQGRKILLFEGSWSLPFFQERNPGVTLTKYPIHAARSAKAGRQGMAAT